MNNVIKTVVAMCVVVIISFFVAFIMLGCSSPSSSSNNSINVSVGNQDKEPKVDNPYTRELTRNCSPRSKCPHLWRWVDSVNKRKID